MGQLVLKKEYLDKIRRDPKLFGKIFCNDPGALDMAVGYGLQLLKFKDPRLTQAGVLQIISEHEGVTTDFLLEEVEPRRVRKYSKKKSNASTL